MDRDPERPLNIGYLSPDFCTHSVAFFIEEVLAHHDRKKVKVFCYSNTPGADDFTQRFQELADHFRDIRPLSDDAAAEMIRKDKIDILVDLAGHTRNNRLLVFARKPAPVQLTWLGYPDTTGLSTMDYRLTDAIADPEGAADHRHSETLVRMPHGFLCYRPAGEFYPVSKLPMLNAGGVTFGSFNNNSKISLPVITAWAAILKRVPESRLKLKSRSFGDSGSRKAILEEFETHGVPAERILFEGYRLSLKEHSLLYSTVDIALDTFPYNGTTTTCEALWMGVPVITLSGDCHVSRVGQSILTHLGFEEWVGKSLIDYVDRAVALACDPERLGEIRASLRGRMIDSPLLDAIGFTAVLEGTFRSMWSQCICRHVLAVEKKQGLEKVYGKDPM
jgi:predicted O-linked N-acetylglucosamine transferase (SPINDLY family)